MPASSFICSETHNFVESSVFSNRNFLFPLCLWLQKDGEKKAADKKDDGPVAAVFKMDMHCEGCAKKVKRVVRNIDGIHRNLRLREVTLHLRLFLNPLFTKGTNNPVNSYGISRLHIDYLNKRHDFFSNCKSEFVLRRLPLPIDANRDVIDGIQVLTRLR